MAFPVISTILQGIVLSAIGIVAYSMGDGWFKAGKTHQFDSKEVAQATLLGYLLIAGWIGPPILNSIQTGLVGVTFLQEIGIVLGISRIFTNGIVGWTQTDLGSILQYTVAIFLILAPEIGIQVGF